MIEPMMSETIYFEQNYPTEDYEQGPELAVQELAVRYLHMPSAQIAERGTANV